MLSCEFSGNFKNTYSVEHLLTATSENKSKRSAKFSQFLFNVNQLFHFDLIEVNESRYNHRGISILMDSLTTNYAIYRDSL